ncbi:helix-turn-helix domain-containing protein [Staphylococcus epidermidis]|nr:helix-turn-helix domain-containing protein [Staphylococcus epidermidis]
MLYNNLRRLRNYKGLTQEELALELQVTLQTIYKWEKGKSVPDMENMKNIANFYNVNIDDLINKECCIDILFVK